MQDAPSNSGRMVVGQRFSEIDGLRALAILLVLLWHASTIAYSISNPPSEMFWTRMHFSISILGASGVALFFVISAFLITGILIDTADEKDRLKKFYIRRSLRIFPLFYMAIIFISIASFVYEEEFRLGWGIVPYALYYQNWISLFDPNFNLFQQDAYTLFNHLWSLSIEEQFYIFWPFVFLYLHRNFQVHTVIKTMLLLTLASFVLRLGMTIYTGDWVFPYTWTISRLDGLFLGALLAYIVKENAKALDLVGKIKDNTLEILLLSLVFLCFLPHVFFVNVKYIIFISSIVSFLLLADAARQYEKPQDKLTLYNRMLRSKAAGHIAEVSYGLYIFHWPIMNIIKYHIEGSGYGYWMSYVILLFLGGAASFIVSWLSYKFFEKPILKLKDKYAAYESK